MLVLVAYDVKTTDKAGERRLRKIAKLCQDFGIRVQYSLFECSVDPARWEELKNMLLKTYKEDKDSLRFYFLGKNWDRRVEHHGAKKAFNIEKDALIL